MMIVPVGKPHSRPIIKMIAYAQHFDTCIDLRKLVITPVSSIKGSRIGTMDEYHSCNPWVHPDLMMSEFKHANLIIEAVRII